MKRLFFQLLGGAVLTLVFFHPFPVRAEVTAADVKIEQAKLEQELAVLEEEIAAQTKLLQTKQQETGTIQRDVDILTGQITRAKLTIKAKKLEIERLGNDIAKREDKIDLLNDRIAKEEVSLAELLRQSREIDQVTLSEIILEKQTFSEIFTDDNFIFVQKGIHEAFSRLRESRQEAEDEKRVLLKRRDAEADAKQKIEEEKQTVETKESEKKVLLKITKNQEAAYQQILKTKQDRRQAILTALFRLQGSAAIPFSEALDHANFVSKRTGVRPAFLLAILTQESRLGENIGTCNRPGDPPEKSWRYIMKPSRDQQPYLRITAALGLNPDVMPLSCPYNGSGYGGAMGPAQFIPSTWELYQSQVAAVVGSNPPNPWRPRDAFAASGLYLSQLGASDQNFSSERRAALKYYAGSNWAKSSNAFYGDSVMRIAQNYQEQIDFLQNN